MKRQAHYFGGRDLRRQFLPYCVIRLVDAAGKNPLYAILNREYKPLGMPCEEYYDYNRYLLHIPSLARLSVQQKISHDGVGFDAKGRGSLWLYDDGCVPTSCLKAWNAYQARLYRLCTLKYYLASEEWGAKLPSDRVDVWQHTYANGPVDTVGTYPIGPVAESFGQEVKP